ncbi:MULTISPECIES: multidrug efflux SMR transporter [unclassified Paenibacillus]|uniref:DMT family transporter n=1 Tax=unclassified Paenibacillus TaxID=185978 RepID=UPI001C0F66ED|nr:MULTISPECIES: multidrug efflux SMR transporter [unclassified Paenibacillus]MBU5441669.1 multidrug efflux SMR transporter [Paenibacillus sp. MSJ-34]CAH0118141.1 putative guanidinium efflux system subunit GdnD [Paenibacillus sp. CECT 9249]
MAWLCLVLAGLCEVTGVIGIKKVATNGKLQSYLLLIISFAASFSLLSVAMNSIPMGTAYAIWTGIGTVGGALVGMFLYNESKDWRRVFFIALVLAGAIGLKLFT